jgi:hypothetical protein
MRRAHHYRVLARLDMASRQVAGTVTIDQAGTFIVRPLRRRRVYALPLAAVADMVVKRVVQAEVFQQRLARAGAKRAGRARRAA